MHPISESLCRVYNGLYARGEVAFPLHRVQEENIDAVVKTVEARYFGITRYAELRTRAAAYFCYLIKDHPVTDGNKRLAVLWLQVYCEALGLEIDPVWSLDSLAVAIERDAMSMDELVEIAELAIFEGTSYREMQAKKAA